MKIAVIDIGTNTVLMVVKSEQSVSGDYLRYARLGQGLGETNLINDSAIDRLKNILDDYLKICHNENVDRIELIATSAMRDAKNAHHVYQTILDHTGHKIRILSGEEEAHFTYLGGIDGLKIEVEDTRLALIDIGGGSTEYITGNQNTIDFKKSLNIGAVRLTEKYGNEYESDRNKFINHILSHTLHHLKSLEKSKFVNCKWVGVAGTITSLSAIKHNLATYQSGVIHDSTLDINDVISIFEEIQYLTSDEILNHFPILDKRADLILCGVLILKATMEYFNFDKLKVSDRGLRYGWANFILNSV